MFVKKFLENEKGIALPLVLLIIAIFTIMGFSAVFLVMNQGTIGKKNIHRMEVLHYAEAGIHEYLGHINKIANVPWEEWDEDIPFGDGFYKLLIEGDSSQLERTITSTGWVKGDENNKRTVQVKIGRRAFNQYSYFSGTDHDIVWTTGEKCYGPYHTNSRLNISGSPTFYDSVTSVGKISGINNLNNQDKAKIFRKGYLEEVPVIEIPPTNYELKERALENGHHYNGRTRILLKGDSYDVKYFEGNTEKHQKNELLPENGVIYIDGGVGTDKFGKTSGNLFISGELSGELTIGAANNIYITGYDPTEDDFKEYVRTGWWGGNWVQKALPTPSSSTQGIVYKNTSFKEKREKGEIVGYEPNTDLEKDLLGLVANKDVIILGKGWFNNPSGSSSDGTNNLAPQNIHINGAIFAIDGGFTYENFQNFKKDNIILRGSLIQKERKAVGQVNGNGYKKNYAHDPRMLYSTPPNFPEPLNTGWEIKEWKEL